MLTGEEEEEEEEERGGGGGVYASVSLPVVYLSSE